MDAKIKAIAKTEKKALKETKSLLKADQKRDKVCDLGKKVMKEEKKKKK